MYFYQMEDHDFGMRLRGLGNAILAVPQAHVLHGEGAEGYKSHRSGTYSKMRVYLLDPQSLAVSSQTLFPQRSLVFAIAGSGPI